MENISIKEQRETEDGWEFEVLVGEAGNISSHTVSLSRAYWEKLTEEKVDPEELVEKSFVFLLEREPKESILPQFKLPVIGRYFPEYEEDIGRAIE